MNYEQLTVDELNRLVAEKVMGWIIPDIHWQPAANIPQAFEVADKLIEMNLGFHVAWLDYLNKWAVYTGQTGAVFGDLLPRAICIASLKAVEGKEGKE